MKSYTYTSGPDGFALMCVTVCVCVCAYMYACVFVSFLKHKNGFQSNDLKHYNPWIMYKKMTCFENEKYWAVKLASRTLRVPKV